jgi:hypothetical protein
MATQETQILDDIIVKSRRKMLSIGTGALAGMFLGASATTANAAGVAYSDSDILNFALNLEFLEANFYYLAAFGCTINSPNAAAITAGAPSAGIPITGSVGTPGTVTSPGAAKVPFSTVAAASYAIETAIEEGKHVLFLQKALGNLAIAMPNINLGVGTNQAFTTLATAAGVSGASSYSPYANDNFFLIGAYIFEDVGVTAYHGAASLLTSAGNLSAAGGIMAVEAYHAGLVRTTINSVDTTGALTTITNQISTLRAQLATVGLAGVAPGPYDGYISSSVTVPDDFGLATFTSSSLTPAATLGAAATSPTLTRIVDADPYHAIAFSRNTNQVLNIVTGGGKVSVSGNTYTTNATAAGVFFPNGMNAGPNGFK